MRTPWNRLPSFDGCSRRAESPGTAALQVASLQPGVDYTSPRMRAGDEVVAASFEGRPADPAGLDPRDLALHIARVLGELAAADQRES